MITVENLTKYYGDHLAVDNISFEIEDGHVYGFLGPNGAGKSTTMNIITGCLSATEGHVKIGGHDIFEEPKEAKKLIGYLPEMPPLYMNETPVDYLTFVGKAKGLKGKELKEQVARVIEQTGIEKVKTRRIATFSKGYKQRVGIAQALLGNPQVIILDEPTVGLDPLQIIEIRDLIKSLGEDHTVIFSSHILSEVQAICDQILMISKGKVVAFDTPENLEANLLAPNEINITTDASCETVSGILDTLGVVSEKTFETDAATNYLRVHLKTTLPDIYSFSRCIFNAFSNANVVLLEMNLKKANLEDLFIELAENANKAEEKSVEPEKEEKSEDKEEEEE